MRFASPTKCHQDKQTEGCHSFFIASKNISAHKSTVNANSRTYKHVLI